MNQRRVSWSSAVRGLEVAVGLGEPFGIEDGLGASTDQLGTVRPEGASEGVELLDEIVIELHEYLTSSHVHRVNHMVEV